MVTAITLTPTGRSIPGKLQYPSGCIRSQRNDKVVLALGSCF